jgi:hypothetical protein
MVSLRSGALLTALTLLVFSAAVAGVPVASASPAVSADVGAPAASADGGTTPIATASPAASPAESSESPAETSTPSPDSSIVTADGNASVWIERGADRSPGGDLDRTIRGKASVPVGTELTVRIWGDDPVQFLKITSTTVEENGQFRTEFDLPNVTLFAPALVHVSVRRGGKTLATASVLLSPEESQTTADSPSATTPTPGSTTSPSAAKVPRLPGGRVEIGTPPATTPPTGMPLARPSAPRAIVGGGSIVAFLLVVLGSAAVVTSRR